MEGTLEQPPEAPEGRETRGADARTEPQEWASDPWIAEPSTAHDAEGRKVGRHKPEDRPRLHHGVRAHRLRIRDWNEVHWEMSIQVNLEEIDGRWPEAK